jgi:hypothetical protein
MRIYERKFLYYLENAVIYHRLRQISQLIFIPLFFLTSGVSAQIKLSGTVIDVSTKKPLEFANIALLNPDSVFINGTSCDSTGFFAFNNLPQGDYLLSSTFVGYNKTYTPVHLNKDRNLGIITLQPSGTTLKEVTVTGTSTIQKTDRVLLIPSAMQRKASNNGLILLNNMQLPRIEINPLLNTITTSDGKAVQLRINGVGVTTAEVIALQPQDIIRIEYHDNPGMRYGNAAAVIDYIIRRRESGGNVAADFGHVFWKMKFADDYLSAKINHKKSEFGVNAHFRSFDMEQTRENRQTFVYSTTVLHQDEIGMPIKLNEKNVDFALNYNLSEPNKYLFNVTFRNNYYEAPHQSTDRNSTLYSYAAGGDTVLSSVSDHSTWRSNTPSLDIYFQRNLKRDQLLIFDVVGTYINSKSTRLYQQTQANAAPYIIYSDVAGNKYSLIAEGIYEKKWKTGTLTAGLKHWQSYTDNDYTGSMTSDVGLAIAETYGYAEYQLQHKKFNYTFGLGTTRVFTSQDGSSLEQYVCRPRLRMGYTINKNAYVRYNGYITNYNPSLSDLNNVTQHIDALQVQQGNPNLRTELRYNNEITAGWNKEIFQADLYAQYFYIHQPAMEETTYSDSLFVHTVVNQGAYHHLYFLLAMKLKPWKNHLTLGITPSFDRYIMTGNNYVHTHNEWSVRYSLQAMYKNWVLSMNGWTRRNDFYGETLDKNNSPMLFFTAGYNTPKWGAFIMLVNPFTDESSRGTVNYSALAASTAVAYTRSQSRVIAFKFSLNLGFGRKYNAAGKRLDNEDTDAGVMTGTKKI